MPWLGGCCPPLAGHALSRSPGTPVTASQWFLCGGSQDTGQDLHLPGTHSAPGTQQGQKRRNASPCPGSPDCCPLLCETPNRARTVLLGRGSPPPTAGHTCRRTLGSAFGPVSRQYLVFASVDVPSGGQAKQEQGSCHLPAFHPPDFCQTVKEKFAAGTDNAEASQTLACGQ